MRAFDLFGLAVAAVIALLVQIVEPWSRPWWVGMIMAALIAALSGGNLLWNALPEHFRFGPALWSPDGGVQHGKTRGLIGVALLCLLVGGGFVASQWRQVPDTQIPILQAPPAPTERNETLVSKYNHMIFLCDKPIKDNEKNEWKEYASVVGASQGILVVFTDLENGGLKFEATPPQPSPIVKATTEIRRLKDQLYVTRILEMSAAYAWMALPITDTNDPQLQEQILRVERLIGAQPSACHFF
jgi:hypothetical protein